jgi:hypothetical protein
MGLSFLARKHWNTTIDMKTFVKVWQAEQAEKQRLLTEQRAKSLEEERDLEKLNQLHIGDDSKENKMDWLYGDGGKQAQTTANTTLTNNMSTLNRIDNVSQQEATPFVVDKTELQRLKENNELLKEYVEQSLLKQKLEKKVRKLTKAQRKRERKIRRKDRKYKRYHRSSSSSSSSSRSRSRPRSRSNGSSSSRCSRSVSQSSNSESERTALNQGVPFVRMQDKGKYGSKSKKKDRSRTRSRERSRARKRSRSRSRSRSERKFLRKPNPEKSESDNRISYNENSTYTPPIMESRIEFEQEYIIPFKKSFIIETLKEVEYRPKNSIPTNLVNQENEMDHANRIEATQAVDNNLDITL